ncbi:MAG: trypsin-like peptidase domain-containing protein, partial [Bdellovibrionaceae bacterium]|nr:trypsin-like peptidase domain-containing protein [Pseudobdellovibrionaceae bacterium]
MAKRILFSILFIFSSSSLAAIFGIDNRVSLLPESPNNIYGRSTAVAVLSSLIEPDSADGTTYQLLTDSLEDYLCKDQRFYNMKSLAYACSGFLVAPDLIVTAGHCMVNTGTAENEEDMYCDAYGWLFDYQLNKDGSVQTTKIPADKYYRCKKIIFAVNKNNPSTDYALVQLDRPVTDRKPLTLNPDTVKQGQFVSMIGYPMGMPMVRASSASVMLNLEEYGSFVTNLDAFDGNSGSAVFNAKNEVIGILIAGTPAEGLLDVVGEDSSCSRYTKCDNFGKNCTSGDEDF